MSKIVPHKEYLLQEIVNEKLIPNVDNYAIIYNLVTKFTKDETGKRIKDANGKPIREYLKETTKNGMKVNIPKKPFFHKITRDLSVTGKDIIKFLKLNGIK